MRRWLTLVCLTLLLLVPTSRAFAVEVIFGQTWDGPGTSLQEIIDARYGVGRINVLTDYMGADPADPDPWFWMDQKVSALIVREIAGNANRNVLGWYAEPSDGGMPVIDDVDDGVVFLGTQSEGATTIVVFDRPTQKFGFYLNPNGPQGALNAPEPEMFFTNRRFNDMGPAGAGPVHAPAGGDVQALVYDLSSWTQPNTWLVCFEDIDSGPVPGPCCETSDNDFNDLVFEIVAIGATTPVQFVTLGALKARYR